VSKPMATRTTTPSAPPSSRTHIPYGRQWIEDDDVAAVEAVLRSDWLTTGPNVERFERAFAAAVGAREAVAVSNGTAALHTAMHALAIGPGDEVVVPAMTFAATANAVVYQGGTPVFADVDSETLLLDPEAAAARVTSRTKAIAAVDYAGQPCDYRPLRTLAERHGLRLVDDACHALGGRDGDQTVGTLADLNTFSLHPVKPITSGEGGVITTADPELARRMRVFRNHGITTDHRQREAEGSWFYEMVELGFNYRLTDFQCALGESQLRKLPAWVARRRAIARRYDEAFAGNGLFAPLAVRPGVTHAHHLYVVQLRLERLRAGAGRREVFAALRSAGIGVNVHYVPVHLHPYYRKRFGTGPGLCPRAEAAYERILTLPLFARMTDEQVATVIDTTLEVISSFAA